MILNYLVSVLLTPLPPLFFSFVKLNGKQMNCARAMVTAAPIMLPFAYRPTHLLRRAHPQLEAAAESVEENPTDASAVR